MKLVTVNMDYCLLQFDGLEIIRMTLFSQLLDGIYFLGSGLLKVKIPSHHSPRGD